VLVKSSISTPNNNTGAFAYQWVASNRTNKAGNFFILENIPANSEIKSVVEISAAGSTQPPSSNLPLKGPSNLIVGPFPIAAGSSVTLQEEVGGSNGSSPKASTLPAAGETFFLLSDSQYAALNQQVPSSDSPAIRQGSPTPNPTNGMTGLFQSALAAPNVSNNNQPIRFMLNLSEPSQVSLDIFTITGEEVFTTQVRENQGSPVLVWDTTSNNHQALASGLYIYLLRASGGGLVEFRKGKILIVR
jgi:hypothetical protein